MRWLCKCSEAPSPRCGAEHEGACWKWVMDAASVAWEVTGGGEVGNEGLGGGR